MSEGRYKMITEVDGERREYTIPGSSPVGRYIALHLERNRRKETRVGRHSNKVDVSPLLTESPNLYTYEVLPPRQDKPLST